MLIEGVMVLTWLGAGAAVGTLLSYRLLRGVVCQEAEKKLRASVVENEALARTNSIYRERIEQLENALFSNQKYLEMAREIERLSSDNFKLRGRLRDLACLVEAEKKKSAWERVEHLERTIMELRGRLEMEQCRVENVYQVEVLPAAAEVAVTVEPRQEEEQPRPQERKKWFTIMRARKI